MRLAPAVGLWVFKERRERLESDLTWCHEKIGHAVWLIAVLNGGKRFELMKMLPQINPTGFVFIFFIVGFVLFLFQ